MFQTLLPAEWAQDTTEQVVSEVVPYILGKTDGFEVDFSLHDPLVATFGAEPGERSVFEAMWLDLNMSERLIRGGGTGRGATEPPSTPDADGPAETPTEAPPADPPVADDPPPSVAPA